MSERETVLVTGYSKAPQGTVMHEVYRLCGVVLEIDPETNVIVDAELTFITDLAQRFFHKLIVGYNLSDGIDGLVERIRKRYLAPSDEAMIAALKTAIQRFMETYGRK
ncbi:MAG: DUF3870 domain-containing protein [Bacillota bacterium]